MGNKVTAYDAYDELLVYDNNEAAMISIIFALELSYGMVMASHEFAFSFPMHNDRQPVTTLSHGPTQRHHRTTRREPSYVPSWLAPSGSLVSPYS